MAGKEPEQGAAGENGQFPSCYSPSERAPGTQTVCPVDRGVVLVAAARSRRTPCTLDADPSSLAASRPRPRTAVRSGEPAQRRLFSLAAKTAKRAYGGGIRL